MSAYKVLTLLVLVLVGASSGISQEGKLKVNKDGQMELTPEMVEKAKKQTERLRDPSFIKLKIELQSNCHDEEAKKVSNCYQAHSKIEIKVLMTNISSESINITINNSYYQYNLQLFRDGELVPYRKEVAEIADKPPVDVYSNKSATLEPGKTVITDTIYLGKWYRPLEPGHYQLDLKRRFLPDGGWTDIASTTFEVEAK